MVSAKGNSNESKTSVPFLSWIYFSRFSLSIDSNIYISLTRNRSSQSLEPPCPSRAHSPKKTISMQFSFHCDIPITIGWPDRRHASVSEWFLMWKIMEVLFIKWAQIGRVWILWWICETKECETSALNPPEPSVWSKKTAKFFRSLHHGNNNVNGNGNEKSNQSINKPNHKYMRLLSIKLIAVIRV